MSKEVSFRVSQQDKEYIYRIARRAEDTGLIPCELDPFLSLMMDLSAVKAQGCSIDFETLLNFEIPDFAHDICGIIRHMDRTTGLLTDCFLPRAARGGGK